ncbi:MAG: C10 family peptidase [Bacteroidales bacterium]|nr:C10 family peptidase [Bacteroidales bacterium]
MKRKLLVILALLLGIATLQAKPVDVAKAQRLGLSFAQHKALFAKNMVQDLQLAYTYRADNGMATMYVFNFDGGYVIVAADDSSSPILGYSDEGNFIYENAPDGLRFMLDEISRGIVTVVEQGRPVSNDIVSRWKNLEAYGYLHADKGLPVVEPLIQQRWDQGTPFNLYVPSGCPTGCVATAMAQIMKYWEWPVKGTGEHSYYAPLYGQQYANFGATTYDWANMIDYYGNGSSQEEREAVATLMYHCGVSVDMNYEPSGSGAYSGDVPGAISTYFSYTDRSAFISKGGNYDEWITLLKSNIDQRFPIYYSGHGDDGGHAFVCDGYDVDGLFHFNFGWGGSYNNYLLIDGENFEYSGSQGVVVDFVPDYIFNAMPQAPANLEVTIDSDVSLIGHLTWTNPTKAETGEPLTNIDKVLVLRNGFVVHEIENVQPGQSMTCDDEVPFFDQYDYAVLAISGTSYGRTAYTKAVFGPYCEWTVIMTSSDFHGWNGGGITVQNAAGSYIDFLTTNTSAAQLQRFQMALGNNNLYWTEPATSISNISFKVKDPQNQVVYEYNGPSSELDAGLLRTLNNSCGNENTCEAPYNLRATVDPDNNQTIVLTWDSDHDPEFGYCIYRDGFLFNMAHELRYVDENTDIGGHCYYVTALCNGGETANSNEYCATSGEGCEPPKDLYFSYNGNGLQLNWSSTENSSVSGYIAYRKTADTPYKRIKLTSANVTSFRDQSAVPGTEYQYVVEAYYMAIDCSSAYANDLFDSEKFFIDVDWSNTPKDLQAELDEEEETYQVNLRWKPAYQATAYDIMRNGEKIGEVNGVVFEDDNLELGASYCYQIVAHGEEFESTTNEACVAIPAPVLPCSAPSNLRREEPFGAAHIAWDAPEDRVPDSYTVVIINHQLNDTTYVTGLTELFYEEAIPIDITDKSYKVKAVYEECESEFALNANGEDFIRVTNLSVNECQMNVKLYPNPTSGQLNIVAVDMTLVSVYDLVGQCVMQMSAKDGQATLDMSQLQNGIYFVKVNTDNGSAVQRVVKM